jgi:uncharacterized repeat protein (TIGR04042 family)
MPEMTFTVRWPDGAVVDCYSPSLVMHDHLDEGATYAVADFVSRSVEALDTASARVQAEYGFACTSAMAQREDIERMAAGYPSGDVTVLRMHPALPSAEVRP